MSTTMKRRLRDEDRISHLPEALLLKILSLLPVKDVVATSVLSKPWRSLWKLVPKLKFEFYKNQSEHETFSEIVTRVLISNKAPFLETLHLDFEVDKCRGVDVGIWLGIAYAHGLRELILDVDTETECFRLPTSFYKCETLESLRLTCYVHVHVPSHVCLKSLRTLNLDNVNYEDDDTFRNLLAGCPNLEDLELYHQDLPDKKIFTISLPFLQRLTVCDCQFGCYVVNAPLLKYLKIEGLNMATEFCLVKNAPELVEATIINVSQIANEKLLECLTSVKRLSLALSPSEIKFPTGSIFCKLVSLELFTYKAEWWNLLVFMFDCSPKLQVLKLSVKEYKEKDHLPIVNWIQPKKVPECLLCQLETFMWEGSRRLREDEKEVAKYILRNTKRLKRATFTTYMKEELEGVVRASSLCHLVFEQKRQIHPSDLT